MSDKHISAEALTLSLRDDPNLNAASFARVKRHIEDAPDMVKRGRWIAYESDEPYGCQDSKDWYKCSECGKDADGRCDEDEWYSCPILSDYCPHCGAEMRGVEWLS